VIEEKLSPNAKEVLKTRYLLKDGKGDLVEDFEGMFRRVVKFVASGIDKNNNAINSEFKDDVEEMFYKMMINLDFLPNSPTLMNAGTSLGNLSACFVLPVEDSMEGIFDSLKYAALVNKSGGGTGFSFSSLRPSNDSVSSTGGVASGPVSFMKVFDSATEIIKQGGRRRGANMGILRIDHPDIKEFILAKQEEDSLNNFNLSVGITEEFMSTLEEGGDYPLYNPRNGEIVGYHSAKEIFNIIVEGAHKNGEPGVVFIDAINQQNTLPGLGLIEATNPCGEQPLFPYESCNLGSLNLSNFVREGEFDFKRLKEVAKSAVLFLDTVIDVNKYPLPEIEHMTKQNRKIGLGVMGWADALVKLGIRYGSEESFSLARTVMKTIKDTADECSKYLGFVLNSFPNLKLSTFKNERRNATLTTIAPTGSISLIAGCSSGIEPLFSVSYKRNVMGTSFDEFHPIFEEKLIEADCDLELIRSQLSEKNLDEVEGIPSDIKDLFVTSHDINYKEHIQMQASFQAYTDNAVSKTINLPNSATIEDVKDAYFMAYKLGCKGLTVYRDGSRSLQVLEKPKKEKQSPQEIAEERLNKRVRPETTYGSTTRSLIGCGKLYITVNKDDYGMCEVFCSNGRGGGCHSQSEATSRLISLAMRSGVPIKQIIGQLRGIKCSAFLRKKDLVGTSCPDVIGRVIESQLEDTSIVESEEKVKVACPDCGEFVDFSEGCVVCRACGYSKCS